MRVREAPGERADDPDDVGGRWARDFGGLLDDLNEIMELPEKRLHEELMGIVRRRRTWELLRQRFHDDPERKGGNAA